MTTLWDFLDEQHWLILLPVIRVDRLRVDSPIVQRIAHAGIKRR
jgi:hypothetical protein